VLSTPTPTATPEKLKLLFSISDDSATPTVQPDSQWEADVQAQKALIAQNPDDEKAWSQLGDLYVQTNQIEEASQCYEQVLRLNPQNQKAQNWLNTHKNQGL
jgi:cytochrome c-type biogenesis protein CcmH/NrfG